MLIAFERNAILGQNLNFERLKLAYVKKVTSRQTLNRKVEIGIESVDDELVLSQVNRRSPQPTHGKSPFCELAARNNKVPHMGFDRNFEM